MKRALLWLPVSLLLIAVPVVRSQQGAAPVHWTYEGDEGPAHWGDLDASYSACKTGQQQSPIDIRNPKKTDLSPIQFDYKPTPLHIIDNGHTIMINYGPGSFLSVGGEKYALKQFHFHRPSEETIWPAQSPPTKPVLGA